MRGIMGIPGVYNLVGLRVHAKLVEYFQPVRCHQPCQLQDNRVGPGLKMTANPDSTHVEKPGSGPQEKSGSDLMNLDPIFFFQFTHILFQLQT